MQTEAYIGQNAEVTALGLGEGVLAKTGEFQKEYLPIEPLQIASSQINTEENTLSFSEQHGFNTGDAIIYQKNNSGEITGLTDGETYYVIVVDDRKIKLAKTFTDTRKLDSAIDLTSATGSGHIFQSIDALGEIDISEMPNKMLK